jgi:hypothetical protein
VTDYGIRANPGPPPLETVRWLCHILDPGSQQIVHAKLPRLDRSIVLRRSPTSFRKDGARRSIAQIWKDHQAAVIGVVGNDMTDGKSRSGKERLPTKDIRRIASSSGTHNGATASSSQHGSMLRGLRDTTNHWGFWKRCFSGMPYRRRFNRLLRPQVPQGHVRLTWICVNTLLSFPRILQS